MTLEDIDSKDCAQSYTNASGWAVISRDCEYEAWTTEARFKRVYHLAPCEEIIVSKTYGEALLLADRLNGIAVPIGSKASI
jgi:hypothetical protein